MESGDDQLVRRGMRLANANAALWAVGNGLVSTTLVVYLALDLGAQGLAISAILAAPRFAGALRLAAPALMARTLRRKSLCLAGYALSGAVLVGMPFLAIGLGRSNTAVGVAVLVASWCVYHLLEYVATVALWSWLGDLMPPDARGRLIGRRERWLTVGRMIGMAASFAIIALWNQVDPDVERWRPLAGSAVVGALLLVMSVLPLARMPGLAKRPSAAPQRPWRSLLACLADADYRRLLVFSCYLAVANGLTGMAQSMYPLRVLGVEYRGMLAMRMTMYAGQSALAPAAGGWVAELGARRVMTLSQLLVATGPLFFWIATPAAPWWVAGAFLVWIAYVGLNVGLDTIKLDLAPAENNAPHLAVYYTLSDLANGVMLIGGGLMYDRLVAGGARAEAVYSGLFLAGFVLRLLAVGLILRLREPPPRAL
ncbi:Major Facilitator Superfamily protein [Pseudobythopirellula maris]|uniref:Major Facilitator Superfamily protein n=1 Tax=Pseudobythopirellula maris TaxID=2527991 RepID=A0A5C5ZNK1_9BACT|nr:MFS transporter [Pseudobythopirellula maris]TWT88696.1 Major Facilitator Superfamily protein [Pseudobythopirellula maris]